MNKYQPQATLGIVSLILVASPLFFKLPAQFEAFNTSTDLELETAKEKALIEQQKLVADKLKETGVLPPTNNLIMRDYFDNPKRNPKPTTTAFRKDETVFVYDSAGICIGKIQNRKWLWKHYYQGICANSENK